MAFEAVLALLAVAVLIAGSVFDGRFRRRRGGWRKGGRAVAPRRPELVAVPAGEPFDAASQLRAVTGAGFRPRRLMSPSEARVFAALEDELAALGRGWRAMAQVCLGEVLSAPDGAAFGAINAKRVDMLIVAADTMPIAAVEYQGGGHYQGDAPMRDAVKKEALRQAGVGYIEVMAGDTPATLRDQLRRLVELQDGRDHAEAPNVTAANV